MSQDDLSIRDRKIIELWEAGKTGGEIAAELSTTRSAILGKIRRLRLGGYVSYKMNAKIDLKDATPKKLKEVKNFNVEKKQIRFVKPSKPLPPIRPVQHRPISLMELTPFSCRFVVNDGHASNFLFCGKPKEVGSYCGEHAKICYIPPKPRGRAA